MKLPLPIFLFMISAVDLVSCFAPARSHFHPKSFETASRRRYSNPTVDNQNYQLSSKRIVLFSSTTDEKNNDESSIEFQNDNERLTKRFQVGSILFGLVSFILFTMPDRTKAVQLASKYGGAAGYGLAAGLCRLLADAARNSRLSSDTYKRLNIGFFSFCFISLFSIPGEAAFHPQFGPAILLMMVMTFLKVWGCSLAFDGWKTGVQESMDDLNVTNKQLAKEFVNGVKSTIRSIFHTPRKGFVYLLYLIMVLAGGFSSIMEAKFYMAYSAPLFSISLEWSALARLALVSTMVYSLKDAAERGRLTGSTFIQMNFMVALWALFVAVGQGTYRRGLSFSKSPMLLMSVPFLYGGIRSLYQKSNAPPPPPPKLDSSRTGYLPLKATGTSDLATNTLVSREDKGSDIPSPSSDAAEDTTPPLSNETSETEPDHATDSAPSEDDSDANDSDES